MSGTISLSKITPAPENFSPKICLTSLSEHWHSLARLQDATEHRGEGGACIALDFESSSATVYIVLTPASIDLWNVKVCEEVLMSCRGCGDSRRDSCMWSARVEIVVQGSTCDMR